MRTAATPASRIAPTAAVTNSLVAAAVSYTHLVTQGGFALYLAVTVLNHGVSGWSLLFYIPIELIIMVVELLAYRRLLTEKSRGRAVGYLSLIHILPIVIEDGTDFYK